MVIYIPTAMIFFYLLFRLVLPSRLTLKYKAAAGVALFLVSQSPLLKRLFFGSLSAPELPVPVLLIQGWLFICLLLLCALVLARDAVRLAGWTAGRLRSFIQARAKPVSLDRRRFLSRGVAAVPAALGAKQAFLSGLIMLPTAYGVSQSIAVPVVKAHDIALPGLPRGLDGFSLVQISDTHVSPLLRKDWVGSLVERVNGCNPDLIIITGDLVDGLPADRADSVAVFRKLKARHGVFACAGNHEYYSDFHAWMAMFAELDIRMLLNAHTVVEDGGGELVIAGVTDPVAANFALPEPDLAAALAGAPDAAPRILLDHRPGNAAANAAARIDLQLSGHTHGGHMLGMTELVAMFNHGYVHGWYDVKGMPMYVNSGAGLWSGFPVRLGVPPEIARITLRCTV